MSSNLCTHCRLVPAVPGIAMCYECAEDASAEIQALNRPPAFDPGCERDDDMRPHGSDRFGNACECEACETWDAAKRVEVGK